jgi:hypothetical protein
VTANTAEVIERFAGLQTDNCPFTNLPENSDSVSVDLIGNNILITGIVDAAALVILPTFDIENEHSISDPLG